MATIEAARGLKLDHKTGSLTPGKEADIVLLDAEALNVAPLNNAAGAVVTLMERTNVDTVIVAGRIRKWQGQLLGHDVAKLRARTRGEPRPHLRRRGHSAGPFRLNAGGRATARRALPAPHPREGALAHSRGTLLEEAQNSATIEAIKASARGRDRHRHRRRDPAGELFEPLRDRARRRGHRQSRHALDARATRTRCRAWWGRSGASTLWRWTTSCSSKKHTSRKVKITVPGPFTMSFNRRRTTHYGDPSRLRRWPMRRP